ncbi:MAG: pyridoxal phosphate-dependent aminotransferase [Candidatus Kerfeldbacteria bacterium]
MLSKRIGLISPSVTLEIDRKAKEMIAAGEDVSNFTVGEPDFEVQQHIRDAAIQAIRDNFSQYTATGGIAELKDAISEKLREENSVAAAAENIIVTNGGKEALFLFFQAVLDEGDEVIVPTPYWVSYAEQIRYAGAVPVMLKSDSHFHFTADDVEALVSDKTKVLILNSPSNPAGAVLDPEVIKEIAALAAERDFLVVSDEVYEHFVYDERVQVSIASLDGMPERTVVINGFSKTYAMPGWRVGYAAGPEEIIKAMTKLKGHLSSNACSIAQKAAVAALTGPQDIIEEMRDEFSNRRAVVVDGFNSITGCELPSPEGAFYAFVNYGKVMEAKGIKDSIELCNRLLDEQKVALVPGQAFGDEYATYARMSFATSTNTIEEGIRRISNFAA